MSRTIQVVHVPLPLAMTSYLQRFEFDETGTENACLRLMDRYIRENSAEGFESKQWKYFHDLYLTAFAEMFHARRALFTKILPSWTRKYGCVATLDGTISEVRIVTPPGVRIPEELIFGFFVEEFDESCYLREIDPFTRT